VVLRYAWPGVLMPFALLGVTTPSAMLRVIVGLTILGAAALRAKLSGRLF
jgi:hypothetical protein